MDMKTVGMALIVMLIFQIGLPVLGQKDWKSTYKEECMELDETQEKLLKRIEGLATKYMELTNKRDELERSGKSHRQTGHIKGDPQYRPTEEYLNVLAKIKECGRVLSACRYYMGLFGDWRFSRLYVEKGVDKNIIENIMYVHINSYEEELKEVWGRISVEVDLENLRGWLSFGLSLIPHTGTVSAFAKQLADQYGVDPKKLELFLKEVLQQNRGKIQQMVECAPKDYAKAYDMFDGGDLPTYKKAIGKAQRGEVPLEPVGRGYERCTDYAEKQVGRRAETNELFNLGIYVDRLLHVTEYTHEIVMLFFKQWELFQPKTLDFDPEFEETAIIEDGHYPIAGDRHLDKQRQGNQTG